MLNSCSHKLRDYIVTFAMHTQLLLLHQLCDVAAAASAYATFFTTYYNASQLAIYVYTYWMQYALNYGLK